MRQDWIAHACLWHGCDPELLELLWVSDDGIAVLLADGTVGCKVNAERCEGGEEEREFGR